MNTILNRIDKYNLIVVAVFSFIFSLIVDVGIEYTFRNDDIEMKIVYMLILFPIIFIIVGLMLVLIWFGVRHVAKHIIVDNIDIAKRKKYLYVSFALIWLSCFVIFLNMYPGTLSCDTPGQLYEAVTLKELENYNPFVNTLLLMICVHIGMAIKDVSLGVAIYTFVQFTLYSLATSYVVWLFLKNRVHMLVVALCTAFFMWPINLIYATGMWKDTFFAVVLLATLAYLYEILTFRTDIGKKQIVILLFLSFLCSLARNSGWSALLVEALCLIIYCIKHRKVKTEKYKIISKAAYTQLAGVVCSFAIVLIVYPLLGIKSLSIHMEVSLPIQQISRCVVEGVSEEEAALIDEFSRGESLTAAIPSQYRRSIVDPVRPLYDYDKIKDNKGKFFSLYFKLGLNHPRAYYNAFIDQTVTYWWPSTSSWLFDNRIFENNYGVVRKSLIFEGKDIAAGLYRILGWYTPLKLLNNSGFTFWLILLCMFICCMKRDKVGVMMCVPFLVIYIGLILFSYACLFRYTYSAVLGMPLLGLYCLRK